MASRSRHIRGCVMSHNLSLTMLTWTAGLRRGLPGSSTIEVLFPSPALFPGSESLSPAPIGEGTSAPRPERMCDPGLKLSP